MEKTRAVIGGTSLIRSSLFGGWKDIVQETPYGYVRLKTKGRRFFIQRHGTPPLPPHRINHRGNIWALRALKVEEIVAINSVGSLKVALKPGSFAVPHDFISFWDVPTFADDEMEFVVPLMDNNLRERLCGICTGLGIGTARAVYVQTKGPRLETPAEIQFLRKIGDVVGMTMASEATLCIEAGIPYASICSIDNYANGIAKVPLTTDEIMNNGLKSLKSIEVLIEKLCAID